jgi:hypothetical protein
MLRALKLANGFDSVLLIDRVIHEKDLYVYNMHNRVEKYFALYCEAGAGR